MVWKAGDQIYLYDLTNGAECTATVGTPAADGSATISGTFDYEVEAGENITATYPASAKNDDFNAKFASQAGTIDYIQDNLDYRIGTSKISVDGDQATLATALQMESQIAIWKLTLQDNAATPAALSATKVTIKNGSTVIAATTDISATSAVYLALNLKSGNISGADITIEATVGSDTYTYSKSGVSLAKGNYYQSTVTMTKPAPAARTLAEATTEDIGKVAGADGKIYANVAAAKAASTTACAIIAYVGSETAEYQTHGLAIAMKDAAEGSTVLWSSSSYDQSLTNYTDVSEAVTTAQSGHSNSWSSSYSASNYPAFYDAQHNTITTSDGISAAAPASGTSSWFLPSLYQWNMIVKGLSGQSADLSNDKNDDYKASSLNTKIEAAGGTGLQPYYYWSSTEYDRNNVWGFNADDGLVDRCPKGSYGYVRSAFAF